MTNPAESPRPAAPAGRSLIAQDVTIVGDIGSDGTVEISGTVQGKIAARTVVLGVGGKVTGSISAESVDLRGTVEGKISCVTLTLRSSTEVRADVNYQHLTIESGAAVDGRFTRPAT